MKNLIEDLEAYRKKADMKKSDMARLMKANSLQQYNNWVYRNSLPDEQRTQAISILREAGEAVDIDSEILEKIQQLPREKANLILNLIDQMSDAQEDR